MNVSEIIAILDQFAPRHLAESWDNTGLLLGRQSTVVTQLMTCLTLTPDVAQEAIENDVQLIVSHHPILFRGAKQISDRNSEGDMLLRLIEAGIAVYSPHTSFDNTHNGINHQWCHLLQLTNPQPLKTRETSQGVVEIGRHGELEKPTPLKQVLQQLMPEIDCHGLQYVGADEQPIQSIAIACGAAGEFLTDAIAQKCDLFITGELRFHDALLARTAGIAVAVVGHYPSERHAVEWLATDLAKQLDGVNCFASQVETDPLQVLTN